MPTLPTIGELLTIERSYYEVLSLCERRWWGVVGLDPNNPTSAHSNHAYLLAKLGPNQFPAILTEVVGCYIGSGIPPRLRFHIPPNGPELVQVAERLGWKTVVQGEAWRAWPTAAGYQPPPTVPGMILSLVGSDALDTLLVVPMEGADLGTAVARAKRWGTLVAHCDTDCLLASIDDEPAAVLSCVWREGWGSIEGVRTRERFRRRGVCTAMLGMMQRRAVERGAAGLLLYTEVEAADRIYGRVGFELVGRLRRVSAWLEGRSPSPPRSFPKERR